MAVPLRQNEEDWEDIDEPQRAYSPSNSSRAGSVGTPRRRQPGSRTIYVALSPHKQLSPSKRDATGREGRSTPTRSRPPRANPKQEESPVGTVIDWKQHQDAVHAETIGALVYFRDVLHTAWNLLRAFFRVLQTPLAILLTLTAIAAAIPYALRPVAQVVAPLCWIPGISSSFICSMRAHTPGEDAWSVQYADYPRMIEMQSRTLEQLLDEKAGGSSLALEIKKAEMATTDLITLVKFSELQSKELIAETLTSFVEDARKTGDDLQRLGAKVGGTVDNIMAVNDHALHTIESAQSKSASSLVARVLWPLGGGDSGTKAVVRTTFDHAMSVMDDALQRVVVEAQVSQGDLLVLEERLNTLHEIVHRENGSIAGDREELLAQLWTWLGGNKDKLRKYERHLRLLRGVGAYRKRALAHVVATLQTLHGMKADMEELRARVAAVPIGGDKIPVEVHIKSIQYGLERLKEGRARARQVEEDAIRKVLAIQD